jgi:hypothetical protein
MPGVVHDDIGDIKKGADGSTTFTVNVYGENGEEAAHNPFAPGGWIEMVFTLKVDADVSMWFLRAPKTFPPLASTPISLMEPWIACTNRQRAEM